MSSGVAHVRKLVLLCAVLYSLFCLPVVRCPIIITDTENNLTILAIESPAANVTLPLIIGHTKLCTHDM